MGESVKSILKRTGEYFQKTERSKLIKMAVLTVVVITFGIVGALLLNRVQYTVLYSGLDASEAGTVMTLLQEMDISAKTDGTDTILVPEDLADELRIELASQGYPSTGLNYDIFSNSSDIGSTDLERQTYLQYQLQENMRTTIRLMEKVEDCVVIVNLATTSSFVVSSKTTEASVAVLLNLEAGADLTNNDAQSISEFVQKCVPNLNKENISIVDSEMNYYDISADESSGNTAEYSATQQNLTEEMKEILSNQVLSVIEPAIGDGNVAVSVNLSLNFDQETVSSVEFYTPIEGETDGLIRSSDESSETVGEGSPTGTGGDAGTDSNGVGGTQYVSDDSTGTTSESTSSTYNYELNEIQTQIQKAQGTVQDLSVAVLVNSNVAGIDGYVDTVKNLVANAIGVDSKYISVELMPFVENPEVSGFNDYFEQSQELVKQMTYKELIKTGLIVATILLIVMMILKFLKKRKYDVDGSRETVNSGQIVDVVFGEPINGEAARMDEEKLLKELVIKKSDEAEKIEELMDRYPETVVQILRTWLVEED